MNHPDIARPRSTSWQRIFVVLFAILFWLGVFEVLVATLLQPDNPASPKLQGLARYFEYGRSIEGKLARRIGPKAVDSDAVVVAGWLDPEDLARRPTAPIAPGTRLLCSYGQSFTDNAVREALKSRPEFTWRGIAGPAAPLSYSMAAYELDDPIHRERCTVVVGVLASSLAKSDAFSMLASTFESPAPFTFPRYVLGDSGNIAVVNPKISNLQTFRSTFNARGREWQDFSQQILSASSEIDRFLLAESVTDRSALVRLARRGWAQAIAPTAEVQALQFEKMVPTSRAILSRMKELADQRQERLIVLLFDDRGFDQRLAHTLLPHLRSLAIPTVATGKLFSSNDPANFVPDGHYSEPANKKIAEALNRALTP